MSEDSAPVFRAGVYIDDAYVGESDVSFERDKLHSDAVKDILDGLRDDMNRLHDDALMGRLNPRRFGAIDVTAEPAIQNAMIGYEGLETPNHE